MDILSPFPMPACVVNDDGQVLVVNRPFAALAVGEAFRRDVRSGLRSDLYPDRTTSIAERAAAGQVLEMLIGADEYAAHLYPYEVGGAKAYLMLLLAHPATAGIDAAMQDQMLKYSVDCIKLVRQDGTLEYMNRAGCIALGVPELQQTFGMPWLELLPADVRATGQQKLAMALAGATCSFPGRSVDPDGGITYWDNLLTPVNDPASNERKVICVSRNVTEEVLAKRRLKELSETDELTGLFNRRCFNLLFKEMVQQCGPSDHVALFLVDFDSFKKINDEHGHHTGDLLLRGTAERWRRALPAHALVARLGGDEFAVACRIDLADAEAQMSLLEDAILSAALQPMPFPGGEMTFGLSVGSVRLPDQADDTHDALVRADDALRHAKLSGKGRAHRHAGPLDIPALDDALR